MADQNLLKYYRAYSYCTHYCEENIWKFCEHLEKNQNHELNSCYVVFISNHEKTVPLWKQKAAKCEHSYVCWDYHVILIHKSERLVYDFDTHLALPASFCDYVEKTFGSEKCLKDQYFRMFRIIKAEEYLLHFASDRSHMLSDNVYLSEPPTYECIKTAESTNNIDLFISMQRDTGWGTVTHLQGLIEFFMGSDMDKVTLTDLLLLAPCGCT